MDLIKQIYTQSFQHLSIFGLQNCTGNFQNFLTWVFRDPNGFIGPLFKIEVDSFPKYLLISYSLIKLNIRLITLNDPGSKFYIKNYHKICLHYTRLQFLFLVQTVYFQGWTSPVQQLHDQQPTLHICLQLRDFFLITKAFTASF